MDKKALISATTPGVIASKVITFETSPESEEPLNGLLSSWCETQIEAEEESNRRRQVLFKFKELINWWVPHVLISKGLSPADAAQYEGRMFTTGSYRYNVHTSGSDIDAVLIAPTNITRHDFFDSFLRRLQQERWVTDIIAVSNAKVPIIAMKCNGVDMDLSFGSIQRTKVPATITDDLLKGLDDKSKMSANAVRVASALIDFAPDKSTFRQALRFIKAWAKVRGIHGSQLGFPTGIGWAILVCNVCQLYPNKSAASVLEKFFYFYSRWFNPNPTHKMNPCVHLSEKRITTSELGLSWDPQENKMHARALFPVLTPVAPSTDSCDMVGEQTLKILCSEFARGDELFAKSRGAAAATVTESSPFGIWSDILEPYPFFENHKTFLHVRVSCLSSAPEKYRPYVDSVALRIKELYSYKKGLDKYEEVALRPCPKDFEDPIEKKYKEECMNILLSNGSSGEGGGDMGGGLSTAAAKAKFPTPPGPLLTCHFFIAMDSVVPPSSSTGGSSKPSQTIDIREIKEKFVNSTTATNARFEEGITRRPEFSIDKLSDIPTWIFDPSKSKVLAARAKLKEAEEAAAVVAAEQAAVAAKLAVAAAEAAAKDGATVRVTGEKRPREEDCFAGDMPTATASSGVQLCAEGELLGPSSDVQATIAKAANSADGEPAKKGAGGSVVRSILARNRLNKAAGTQPAKPSLVVDDIGMDF